MTRGVKTDISEITREQKAYFCLATSEGKPVATLLKELNWTYLMFYKLAETDPFFDKELKKSREHYIHSLTGSLIGITKDCTSMAEVQAARLESDNIKWVAAKALPTVYGDNLNIHLNHHLDLSSTLLAAENRILPLLKQPKTIEVRPISEAQCEVDMLDVPDELKDLI